MFTTVAFKVWKSNKKSWASFMWLLRVSAKYMNCSPSVFLSIYIFWNTIRTYKVTSLRSFSDEKYGQIWELRRYGSTFRAVLYQEAVSLDNEYRPLFIYFAKNQVVLDFNGILTRFVCRRIMLLSIDKNVDSKSDWSLTC